MHRLMLQCWEADRRKRIPFAEVVIELRKRVNELTENGYLGIDGEDDTVPDAVGGEEDYGVPQDAEAPPIVPFDYASESSAATAVAGAAADECALRCAAAPRPHRLAVFEGAFCALTPPPPGAPATPADNEPQDALTLKEYEYGEPQDSSTDNSPPKPPAAKPRPPPKPAPRARTSTNEVFAAPNASRNAKLTGK